MAGNTHLTSPFFRCSISTCMPSVFPSADDSKALDDRVAVRTDAEVSGRHGCGGVDGCWELDLWTREVYVANCGTAARGAGGAEEVWLVKL
jgi:hypothetical protein